MKAPRRAATLAPARPAPRHARERTMTPPAGPLIRITVTVELPGRLTTLLTAAAALMHLLRHGW